LLIVGDTTFVLPIFSLLLWPLPFCNQGDRIGRIFAFWAIVNFWAIVENYSNNPVSLRYFFPRKKLGINFVKNGLGDFFTNSSGHPGCNLFFCFALHVHKYLVPRYVAGILYILNQRPLEPLKESLTQHEKSGIQ
jgi:hypothetical protein